ncbi:MAG: cytochrome c [Chitinophagaceae bacterium]|nr:cytochrome c [Chitinophagaceae bacterium]
MKRITYITATISALILIASGCKHDKRKPGYVYMPDMAYSRAFEAYAKLDPNKFTTDPAHRGGSQIYYDAKPVVGTMARSEAALIYELPNDSNGYKLSATIKNPIDSMSADDMTETKRLFDINCGICHGVKGTADGPIAASGHIGGVANLTLPAYVEMADGTMYHSITYGKNNMGSYASQLSREQRWKIIKYIRTLQPKPATAAKDTTAKAGK